MNSDTNIQTKKIDLIQWLSTIEDESLLDKVTALISEERKNNLWLMVSDEERESLNKGIKNADNGKLNYHAKAISIYGKWL